MIGTPCTADRHGGVPTRTQMPDHGSLNPDPALATSPGMLLRPRPELPVTMRLSNRPPGGRYLHRRYGSMWPDRSCRGQRTANMVRKADVYHDGSLIEAS